MKIIPAVDLMNGKVVRLTKGLPENMTTYDHLGDPVAVAKNWERMGADLIHIIDLDAALERGSNLDMAMEIAKSITIPVQLGGGIRSNELAEKLLQKGIYRVLLGSLAINEPESLPGLLDRYGGRRVAVALDYLEGQVMVRGWKESTSISIDDAITHFLELGVEFFLVTSIAQDGTLQGSDYETFKRVCRNQGSKIIAAGGINSLKDLETLRSIGVNAAVIGKALYEGAIDFGKAKALLENK